MSAKQTQDKLDKRAQALRDNLRKRKPVQKNDKKTDRNDATDKNKE